MLTKRKQEVHLNTPENDRRYLALTDGKFARIDPDRYYELSRYYWRAVRSHNCYYAVRRSTHYGKVVTVRMHRQVAMTPAHQICHHENHDTLDNRRCNLTNMDEHEHSYIHGYR